MCFPQRLFSASVEALIIDDFHVQLHVEQPNGHHAADTPREATAEVVPVLDEGVCPAGVIRHEP